MTGRLESAPGLLNIAEFARLLGRGFAYPDAMLIAALNSGEYLGQLGELAASLGDRVQVTAPADSIAGGGFDLSSLQSEYTSLFARNVPCPLNATAYNAGADGIGVGSVHDLARTAAFYGVFGFRVSPAARELPDHLSVQLEFLGALCAKEAFALDNGWDERAAMCAGARARFAAEHMAPWVPQLRKRLEQHARTSFYPALGNMVDGLVAQEAAAGQGAGDGR